MQAQETELQAYRKGTEQPEVVEIDDEECDDQYPLNTLENFIDEWGIRGQIEKQLVAKAWYRAIESVSLQPTPDVSILVEALEDISASWHRASTSREKFLQARAIEALAAYREQGGSVKDE